MIAFDVKGYWMILREAALCVCLYESNVCVFTGCCQVWRENLCKEE